MGRQPMDMRITVALRNERRLADSCFGSLFAQLCLINRFRTHVILGFVKQ